MAVYVPAKGRISRNTGKHLSLSKERENQYNRCTEELDYSPVSALQGLYDYSLNDSQQKDQLVAAGGSFSLTDL